MQIRDQRWRTRYRAAAAFAPIQSKSGPRRPIVRRSRGVAKRARRKPLVFGRPMPGDWERFVDEIKIERRLDERHYRLRAKQLALDLESEGNAAHRAADLWDLLSGLLPAGSEARASVRLRAKRGPASTEGKQGRRQGVHRRGASCCRVGAWAIGSQARLAEPGALRQQAARLLDAAMSVTIAVGQHEAHVERLRKQRESTGGRPPSIALLRIVEAMIQWGVGEEEMAKRLAAGGIRYEPKTLQVELWRHRQRHRRR